MVSLEKAKSRNWFPADNSSMDRDKSAASDTVQETKSERGGDSVKPIKPLLFWWPLMESLINAVSHYSTERGWRHPKKKQNPRPCSQLLSSRTDQRHVQLVYRVHVSTYSAANEAKVATLVATGRWFTSCFDSLICEFGTEKFTARSRPSSAYLVQISSISDDWLNWYGIWMENVDRAPVVAQITAETDLAEAACGSFLFGWRTVAPKLISDGVTRGLDGSRPCGTFISLHWSLFVHWSTRSSKRRIDDLFQSKS